MTTVAHIGSGDGAANDHTYGELLRRCRAYFESFGDRPIFKTNAEGLFGTYIRNLPEEYKQHHTCHSCRHFMERFGGLAVINADGMIEPIMWPLDVPELYQQSMTEMQRVVRRASVVSPFYSEELTWGQPITGIWTHFAVEAPSKFKHALRNADQAMAEKIQEFQMLSRALARYRIDLVRQALRILEADAVDNSEKTVGIARWLHELHERREAARVKDNITWLAVACAPAGFAHVNTTMIGTLLEDLANGLPFDRVKRNWDEKMHPLKYKRPQAPPSLGNIEQAEKIVEKMGLAPALARRYARFEEIPEFVWVPEIEPSICSGGGGVFDALKKQAKAAETAPEVVLPRKKITWEKFQRDVLINAKSIEYFMTTVGKQYAAITTAVNPNAPRIFQWDTDEAPNPFGWYLWHPASTPTRWGLTGNQWRYVTGITFKPSMWFGNRYPHQGEGVIFLIEGMKEQSNKAGLCLFPDNLRAELHEVRATIEAFSKKGELAGREEMSAAGIMIGKGGECDELFRVKGPLGTQEYIIDRWE